MIGKRVSHYTILEKLGEGGMGVVYKAHDTDLDRDVALKFLPHHITTTDVEQARFLHEARAAALLNHPHICTIHAIETAGNERFIVMEYVEGKTLREIIQEAVRSQGPGISQDRAISYAIQIGEALQEAHTRGITHRDIKADNIMVNLKDQAKVMDFGLAKLKGSLKLTQTMSTVGTLAYMAPEQIRGEEVDARSDIFSFGILLYEMLAGCTPFRGEHEAAMMYSIMNEDPRPINEFRDDLPADIQRIIERCLRKDPGARFSSMADVVDALRHSQPPHGAFTPVAWRQFIRRPVIVLSLVVILLGLGYVLWNTLQESKEVTWARQVGLPEIERLAGETKPELAYALARKVGTIIPDDPIFTHLLPRFARRVRITSDPPGATVYRAAYDDTSDTWEELGISPTDSLWFPLGLSRLKFEKPGYRTLYAAITPALLSSTHLILDPADKFPEGMVHIAGGKFGLNIPGLDHLDSLEFVDYLVDRYEVTNREFKRFIDAGGYQKPEYWKYPFIKAGQILPWDAAVAGFKDATGRPGPSAWEQGTYPEGRESYPVRGVSWYEAAAYAEFAGKLLPTLYHWNHTAEPRFCNYIVPLSNFGGKGVAPAGAHRGMGPFGTYDQAGNVREWCTNESRGKRYIMGGGWNDEPYQAIDAYAQDPFDRSPTNGFRCIKTVGDEPNWSRLARPIEQPYRDFMKEKPVSDDVFRIFVSMFRYDRTDLHAAIESSDTTREWIKQRITFDAAYGPERMIAYLFLPVMFTPPYQCVVYFPGSNAIHDRSSAAALQISAIDFIVKSGRAVMYPIYKGTYERGDQLRADYPDESNFYKDHVIMWRKDLSRSMDYLATREDIDTAKFAYYGLSWGGAMGGIMPAVERRFKVAVLYVAGLCFQRSQPPVEPVNYLPRIRIPVLMLNGKYDFFFPENTSQIPMFALLGTPSEHKRRYVYEASHFVPRNELIKETLDWLDRYLGAVKRQDGEHTSAGMF